jgi:predicted O-linked N-acetylglucosamine transferase (SPINDLY family)
LDLEKAFKLDHNFYKSINKVFMLLCARNRFCEWANNKTLKYNLLKITKKEDYKHLDAFGLFTIFDELVLTNNVTFNKIKELSSDIKNEIFNFNVNKNKKIKVGYFSPDFREHPVGYIVSELFSFHDKDKFEIIGFSLNPFLDAQSKIKNEIIKELDDFIECGNDNYLKIAEKSVNHKIDIAIDLAGFTDYDYDSLYRICNSKSSPLDLSYYYVNSKDSTILDALNEIFVDYQIGAYIDEYGIMRFLSLHNILSSPTSASPSKCPASVILRT